MMQLSLDQAPEFLKLQTPKEYFQQLAAASEALRRAKLRGGAGATDELTRLQNLIEGDFDGERAS
jgi:hypothetical protein